MEEYKGTMSQIDCYEKQWDKKDDTDFYMNIKEDPDKFVKIRLISHNFIPFDTNKMKWRPVNTDLLTEDFQYLADLYKSELNPRIDEFTKDEKVQPEPVTPVSKVIIHVHGGNFISMSSGSHQTYTRTWTRFLNIPVFSIDYRLAPENKYPDQIDDVWQAYVWIVKCSFMHLGITPEKIVLVGDSSGGNLCNAIVMLAIQHNFRVPDQLILCYPTLSLDKSFVYPSLLYSLIDPFMNINFIKIFNEAYLTEEAEPEINPYLSNIKADPLILKHYPSTKIFTGSLDPYRDLAYKFTKMLTDINVDAHLYEFKNFPHAFLSHGVPVVGLTESEVAADCIQQIIKQTLKI